MNRFLNGASGNGGLHWPENPAAWIRAAGMTQKLAKMPDRNPSATSTLFGRYRGARALESTLAHLCEMVGRRLREHGLAARTLQLKLRYSDFSTITRAHSLPRGSAIDTEIYRVIHELFVANWKPGAPVRLLGVHAASWDEEGEQMDLLEDGERERWRRTLAVADRMRDSFGESAVSLASGLRGTFRERTHENPAGLPGKRK